MERKRKRKYDRLPINNKEIRCLLISNDIRYTELADAIHISTSTLSQWLRDDLRDWRKEEILKGIDRIKAERGLEK